jgi:hypothetical protein
LVAVMRPLFLLSTLRVRAVPGLQHRSAAASISVSVPAVTSATGPVSEVGADEPVVHLELARLLDEDPLRDLVELATSSIA